VQVRNSEGGDSGASPWIRNMQNETGPAYKERAEKVGERGGGVFMREEGKHRRHRRKKKGSPPCSQGKVKRSSLPPKQGKFLGRGRVMRDLENRRMAGIRDLGKKKDVFLGEDLEKRGGGKVDILAKGKYGEVRKGGPERRGGGGKGEKGPHKSSPFIASVEKGVELGMEELREL